MVFHYFPSLFYGFYPGFNLETDFPFWNQIPCQSSLCTSHSEKATRICLSGKAAAESTYGQIPAPLYICETCYQDGEEEFEPTIFLFRPMKSVARYCENRECSSTQHSNLSNFNEGNASNNMSKTNIYSYRNSKLVHDLSVPTRCQILQRMLQPEKSRRFTFSMSAENCVGSQRRRCEPHCRGHCQNV